MFAQNSERTFVYRVGDFDVFLLNWGQRQGNSSILLGATDEMMKECIPQGTFPNATNAFLIKTPEKNILIDAGYEDGLVANLHTCNIHALQIDIILITHMHGDHIGGLLAEGKVRFPNAEIYIPQPEYDYWMSDEQMNKLPEDKQRGFKMARQVVEAYKGKIQLFIPNKLNEKAIELLPGITPLFAPGHTPGHTMYLLESGDGKLLVWGDLTHAMAIQMPYPKVAVTYDVDPKLAITSRKEVLEYVVKNNLFIAGMHIAFPAMGKIKEEGAEKYLFLPLGR
jgi:glyoxylase-like metal-dependent hydrolase (beta-lactamase superfamily II)